MPAMDLSRAISGSLSIWYINRSGDGFGVYYRVNGGAWNELFYTGAGHTNWTELSLELTGFADNYQIGFRQRDYYKYGIYLDDLSINILYNTLCDKGTISDVVANTGTYTWTCAGINGGNDASCSATRLPDTQEISCGDAPENGAWASGYATFTQRWNGSAWLPEVAPAPTDDGEECRYTCNTGYVVGYINNSTNSSTWTEGVEFYPLTVSNGVDSFTIMDRNL